MELTAQHVFGETGFGFLANATFVGTNKPYNPSDISGSTSAVPGLANSWNFVAFYDKNGFQARIAVNRHDDVLQHWGSDAERLGKPSGVLEPTFVARPPMWTSARATSSAGTWTSTSRP